MNGFVNTLLSVMLSWIRALISNLWTMMNSEDGGALYQFLRSHWLTMVIILCAACMAVDLIVYFFRWRPDYVWASKWRRLRRKRSSRREEAPAEPLQPQEAFYAYQQPQQDTAPTMSYAPLQATSNGCAPAAQATQVWPAYSQAVAEEAVFDGESLWDDSEPLEEDWQLEDVPAYGTPKPEPLAYFRDVQAGFAPAVSPEQLYTPSASFQAEPEAAPVHPGLDEETFRQSLGLNESSANPYAAPVMRAPVFRPFTVTREPEPPVQQTGFQRFAQRALDFMALDESERRTIRDLQSSVDVSKAFHEPVYPQSYPRSKE